MRVKIVGSAAGGGFPQWNCNYYLSRAARAGTIGVWPRTQSSLAVSADGQGWVLFNASPDIRQQIASTPELQPQLGDGPRNTPIRAVVLTNADVDHIAGLLSLREREPFAIYATERVLSTLQANSIFNVLDPAIVPRRRLTEGEEIELTDAADRQIGIRILPFSVPGKVALYLEDAARPQENYGSESGDTIAVRIAGNDDCHAAFYIPGCARIDPGLRQRLAGADCLFFDGTLYTDDEMLVAGVGPKTGQRMGHLAMSGRDGSISQLADVPIGRRIFVHINNTNPVLDESSVEHETVHAAGWEIGHDGMEIEL
jgi:pyrroloquinoline quinone biosynthesis protein B